MKSAAPLLIFSILAVMVFSGCTGLDPEALAKSNSMIQQFLNEHPNAQIVVTHFTANHSKYMIDQIRKDCDNPYLDEKEFYRVNITDPDTNFYAIVWIDWETKTIECVFKIGTEGKTVENPNPGNCTNHAHYKCYNSHVYWLDSCGNVQDKKEYCKQGCSDTSCLGECKSNAEYRCYGDHVYWFDSCGNKIEKKEYCDYGCENGFCKTKPAEKTCEEAGGYCIWTVAATASSEAGGQAAATGMMVNAETAASVSVETTATNIVVSYQCKEGYEVGKYFCKEGGICCLPVERFCGSSTQGPCESDSDCMTSGCSGQVCQSLQEEPASTTCEYKECYSPVKYGMECRCMGSPTTAAGNAGKCMWSKPVACTDDAKVCPDGSSVSRNPNKNCEFDPCPTSAKYYRNAYWQCYDGTEANEGGETSCKSYETWKQYADESCKGKCTTISAISEASTAKKCGVNSFKVWNECNAAETCTDSDGGKSYYHQGTATASGQSYTDHCNQDGTLTEKYCSGSQIAAEVYQCPYGCSEGACLQQQANNTNTTQ